MPAGTSTLSQHHDAAGDLPGGQGDGSTDGADATISEAVDVTASGEAGATTFDGVDGTTSEATPSSSGPLLGSATTMPSSAALAVAQASAEVPRPGPLPPGWLGEAGQDELVSARVLLSGTLLQQFDRLWGAYQRRCADIAELDLRASVLARALELLRSGGEARDPGLVRELATVRSRRDDLAQGPWSCVLDARAVVVEHHRRRTYGMAAARWTSRLRAAQDELSSAGDVRAEVLAVTVWFAAYFVLRLALTLCGFDGADIVSAASVLAAAVATPPALRTYLRLSSARSLAVARATDEVRHARRMLVMCRGAEAGGPDPAPGVLNDAETRLLVTTTHGTFTAIPNQ